MGWRRTHQNSAMVIGIHNSALAISARSSSLVCTGVPAASNMVMAWLVPTNPVRIHQALTASHVFAELRI